MTKNVSNYQKTTKKKFRKIILYITIILSISCLNILANEASDNDCNSPNWIFWGESIGCAWMSGSGHIANFLPDGSSCCAIRTHAQYYIGIKFKEWNSCDAIPCPN